MIMSEIAFNDFAHARYQYRHLHYEKYTKPEENLRMVEGFIARLEVMGFDHKF